MRNIKGILPGIFTMGNLACGFGAIIISGGASYLTGFQRDFRINEAVWLIILAAFFRYSRWAGGAFLENLHPVRSGN